MKTQYPFPFEEMLLTNKALDVLGFTEYWAGSGDYGRRTLSLGGEVGNPSLLEKGEAPFYSIFIIDEMDDETSGYGPAKYCPEHICTKDFERIYFLHEMYEDIFKKRNPAEVNAFIELTKKANMYPFLKSYIDYIEAIIAK